MQLSVMDWKSRWRRRDGYYPRRRKAADGVRDSLAYILSLSDEEMAMAMEAKANFDK